MNLRLQTDTAGISWEFVASILREAGMANFSPECHKQAFENSQTVIFVFDCEKLIGFGRALSDGTYQSAIYDVAVLPEYQGKGIGKIIVDKIVGSCPDCNIILYASPGNEGFYEKFNFRRMKTGMALFTDPGKMKNRGFTE
jgi:ribosomal protein S18 acetylase RimI-like enzyme